MAIRSFLAMTAEEFHRVRPLPEKVAWMACHFAPYDRGLTDLPKTLPAGSVLLLDDRIEATDHDPEEIIRQLTDTVKTLSCHALVLDLQRSPKPLTLDLCRKLVHSLPCPVAVPPAYATDTDHPLFVPPVPLGTAVGTWLAPWTGRDLWLELALDTALITVGPEGSRRSPLPPPEAPLPHKDESLHCHYQITVAEDALRFTLTRTRQDLQELLEEAGSLGVHHAMGLYQEL